MTAAYPTGQLQPRTEPGRRFVASCEQHADVFRERAGAHDRAGTFPKENYADLQKSGVLAAFVPEALGGGGLESAHDWATGLERLGRGDPSTAIALNMHLGVTRTIAAQWYGARAANDEAALARTAGLLGAIASGDLVIAATATEPGTDFLRPLTTATRTDTGYRLDGRKIFVTGSPVATLYALNVRIPAEDGDASERDRMGFAFLPASLPGLELQGDWDALGMRASGSQSLVLRDCVVPEGTVQIAGEWGRWSPGLLMGRTTANLTLVGVFLGIAERARTLAVEGALAQHKPKHGGAIAQAAGVQHLLGEIDIELAAARGALRATADRLDVFLTELGGASPSMEAAHECMRDYQTAKWTVNQNALSIVSKAMDVCGGGAFMSGHELSRLYRDARAGPFMQPFSPTELHEYVGRIALGMPPEG